MMKKVLALATNVLFV